MRVLVADDDRFARVLLGDLLESWGHEVLMAEDGEEAWQILENDSGIAILLTDWVMPGLDGPSLCRRLRGRERERYLPIILVTSQSSQDHLIEGLQAGADCFVTKPVAEGVLWAQLQTCQRILALESRLSRKVRALEEASQRIHRDLEAAAAIQKSHLPEKHPTHPGVDFAWVYDACETLGGDMFNVFRLDEEHVGVYILDVSGHGTTAALLSVALSRVLVPLPQQGGILKGELEEPPFYALPSPAAVAEELNRRFQTSESGLFATFLYGILNPRSGVFRFVSAGHPGPVHILAEGEPRDVGEAAATGPPIGIVQDAEYGEQEILLAPGSRLLLYTDGVDETQNQAGENFGRSRIVDLLSASTCEGSTLEDSVATLRKSLLDFSAGEPQRDDITIVGLGITDEGPQ